MSAKMQRKFKDYIKRNPVVWHDFDARATYLASTHHSSDTQHSVWEIVAYLRCFMDYHFSNNLNPYFARKWLREHPEHVGFFVVKPLKKK